MPTETAEQDVIDRALAILQARLKQGEAFLSSECVKSFLRLRSQGLTYEVFGAMFLDAAHRLITYERLFRGTLTHTSVHPREVVLRALALNAAAVIAHHNHPSGCVQPSGRDISVTSNLKSALELVDVVLLDHVITSDFGATSLAQLGLM